MSIKEKLGIDLDKDVLWIGHYKCMRDAEREERALLYDNAGDIVVYRKWKHVMGYDQVRGLNVRHWELRVEEHGDLSPQQIEALKYWDFLRRTDEDRNSPSSDS